MKLWFPSRTQWVVMWIGLIVVSVAVSGAIGFEGHDWSLPMFILIATVFIVWMLEGRRRKLKAKNEEIK